jgi:hypothetical protein
VSALLILTALATPSPVPAQGVTTAALQGAVTREDGSPIAEARVEVVNSSTGQRWQVETGSRGRYFLETVAVGGPYSIEVSAIGFEPEARSGIYAALGQRYTLDVVLKPSAFQLSDIAVVEADPRINAGRTGAEQVVTEGTIARLPNPFRNLTGLQLSSPLVNFAPTGGTSIAGQNDFFNSVQVDGGMNNDLYFAGPRTISINAVREFQVLTAPFDVRHGSFTGGLLNAVTRAGTNDLRGSAFGFFQNQGLIGDGPAEQSVPDFSNWQFGGSLAGPIVRDRVHYYMNLEAQRRISPDVGPFITDTAEGRDTLEIGIRLESAERFARILSETYRLAPGTLGPSDVTNPNLDLLGKVTAQAGRNSQLEVSHHYRRNASRGFVPREFGAYFLSSVSQEDRATTNTSRIIWNALLGRRASNELILSYLRLRDACRPETGYSQILVAADAGVLVAGSDPSCLGSRVHQDAVEVTDNVAVGLGDHLLTVGTHSEFLHIRDPLLLESQGLWFFPSLDAFEDGQATFYRRGLPGPLRPEGPIVDFSVRQLGLYVQDRWSVTPRFTLTGGFRVDVPFLPDRAVTNPDLEASLGIDTGRLPSGNPLWSPRLGISYDVSGDSRSFLRGGIGIFSGRPPYRWIGNAYRGSGAEEAILTCRDGDVPAFDPVSPPSTCGTSPQVTPRVSVLDPGLRFPQNLKIALGADHSLPWDLVATVDLLYTRGIHQFYYDDGNLAAPIGSAAGEGGRLLYGSLDSDGTATPVRLDPAFGPVVRVSNRSGDRAFSATAQLQRRFRGGVELNGSYTYTRAQDLESLVSVGPLSNLSQTPLDGTLADRRLRTSTFETRHRIWLNGIVGLPFGIHLSLTYLGFSGSPYSYAVDGDANGDNLMNDLVYVPRSSSIGGDINLLVEDSEGNFLPAPASEFERLDAFIEGEECLRNQRGRLLTRNSCLNPWVTFTTARLAKTFRTWRGQSIELEASVFNLLNLLDGDWGHVRGTTDRSSLPLLRLVGYDQTNGRGVYQLTTPPREGIVDGLSRWQLLVGAKYAF